MALSYYSHWDAFQHELIEETDQLPPELYNDSFALPPDDSYFNIAQLFEPEPNPEPDYLFSSSDNNYVINPLPNNNNNQQIIAPAAELTSFEELQYLQPADYSLKRQKLDYEGLMMYSDEQLMVGLTNYKQQQLDRSGYMLPAAGAGFCGVNKPAPVISSLSAQSIAARQRRRKISEKTQELGKLIPGANKLNTAEMFQAAYKYIQFLQAQVGILEFMASNHHHQLHLEKGELIESEEAIMYGLLGSTLVQEKLYATEKCIVPRKFVQELEILNLKELN